MENMEAVSFLTETEKEVRRTEIIQRLRELATTVPGGSADNEARYREVQSLEMELHQIDPPGGKSTPPDQITEERRVRPEDRELISNLLDELKHAGKK